MPATACATATVSGAGNRDVCSSLELEMGEHTCIDLQWALSWGDHSISSHHNPYGQYRHTEHPWAPDDIPSGCHSESASGTDTQSVPGFQWQGECGAVAPLPPLAGVGSCCSEWLHDKPPCLPVPDGDASSLSPLWNALSASTPSLVVSSACDGPHSNFHAPTPLPPPLPLPSRLEWEGTPITPPLDIVLDTGIILPQGCSSDPTNTCGRGSPSMPLVDAQWPRARADPIYPSLPCALPPSPRSACYPDVNVEAPTPTAGYSSTVPTGVPDVALIGSAANDANTEGEVSPSSPPSSRTTGAMRKQWRDLAGQATPQAAGPEAPQSTPTTSGAQASVACGKLRPEQSPPQAAGRFVSPPCTPPSKPTVGCGSVEMKPKQRRDRNYGRPGKYRGVRYRGKGRWSAEIKVREARRWLGIFQSAEEAARAFDKAAFEIRGSRARLNFPAVGPGQQQVMREQKQQQQQQQHHHHHQNPQPESERQAATTSTAIPLQITLPEEMDTMGEVAITAATDVTAIARMRNPEEKGRSGSRSQSSSIRIDCEEMCVASEGEGDRCTEADAEQHFDEVESWRSPRGYAVPPITAARLMPKTPTQSPNKQQQQQQQQQQPGSALHQPESLSQQHLQLPVRMAQHLQSSSQCDLHARSDGYNNWDLPTHGCTAPQSLKRHTSDVTCQSPRLPCSADHVSVTPQLSRGLKSAPCEARSRTAGGHLATQVSLDGASGCTAGADSNSGCTRTSQSAKRLCHRQSCPPSPPSAAACLSTSFPQLPTAHSSPARSPVKVPLCVDLPLGLALPRFVTPSMVRTLLGRAPAVGVPAAQLVAPQGAGETSTGDCYTAIGVPLTAAHSRLQLKQEEARQEQERRQQDAVLPLVHSSCQQEQLDAASTVPPPSSPRPSPFHSPPSLSLPSTVAPHGSGILSPRSRLAPLSLATCNALRTCVVAATAAAIAPCAGTGADAHTVTAALTVSNPFPLSCSHPPSTAGVATRASASQHPRPHTCLPIAIPSSALTSTLGSAAATNAPATAELSSSFVAVDSSNDKEITYKTDWRATAVCGRHEALLKPCAADFNVAASANSHTWVATATADHGPHCKYSLHTIPLVSTCLPYAGEATPSASVTLAGASFHPTNREGGGEPAPGLPVEEHSISSPFHELLSGLWGLSSNQESRDWNVQAKISELLNDSEPPSAASGEASEAAPAAAAAKDDEHNHSTRVDGFQCLDY